MTGAFPVHVRLPLIFPTIMSTSSPPPTLRFLTAEDQKRGDLPTPPPPSLPETRPRPRGRMFENIAELSKSDRRDRSKVRSSSGSGEEEANVPLQERLNPATAESEDASVTPSSEDKDRTCSPPHPSSFPYHSKDSEQEPSEGYHSMELSKGEKPGPHSALLRVSEAHLAILPDEDGDTLVVCGQNCLNCHNTSSLSLPYSLTSLPLPPFLTSLPLPPSLPSPSLPHFPPPPSLTSLPLPPSLPSPSPLPPQATTLGSHQRELPSHTVSCQTHLRCQYELGHQQQYAPGSTA